MTQNQKPCLKECRCVCADLYENHRPSQHAGKEYEHHAPNCPNAPLPADAAPAGEVDWSRVDGFVRQPVDPDDSVTWRPSALENVARAITVLRTEVAALRAELEQFKAMANSDDGVMGDGYKLFQEVAALRAQLAELREKTKETI